MAKTNEALQAEIARRKQAEEKNEYTLSLLNATTESIGEGVLVVDKDGRITSFNQQFVRMWHIPESIIASRDDDQALEYVLGQLKDPQRFLSKVRELYIQQDAESFDTLEFKDGRVFERYSQPQRLSDQNVVGRAWIFRDVTERKRMEETLRVSVEEAKRLAQENAIMAEIGRIVSSTLNIEDVYERFAEEVRKLISFDRIAINTVNLRENIITALYVSGLVVQNRQPGLAIPLSGSLTETVLRRKQSSLIQMENRDESIRKFPGLLAIFNSGLQSLISVPLISKDEAIGTLHLQSVKANAYTEMDVRLTERVANQISGAIANAQLYIESMQAEKKITRLAQENAIVAEIGCIINSTIDINEVYQAFSEKVHEIIPFDRIAISIINYKDDTFTVPYAAGMHVANPFQGMAVPLVGTITEKLILTRKAMLLQEEDLKKMSIGRIPSPLPSAQAGIRTTIAIPLISKDEVIGALRIHSTQPNAYSGMDVRLAERVGNQIAGAIANTQLFVQLAQAEEKQKKLVHELQEALAKVKTLSGFLPICASCKKIRDDKGYWNQVESYVSGHSEVTFTHSICPECMKKLYPDFADEEK